ncbi:hypothetical protein VTK73DRAFT_3960 [Phialemonium thermophilum]|uniref:Uncharacterized protein n=1 Tax=Phialemonium thermophilum TaxID=223376 RepID=A0ABR3Y0Y1_9PEZI
MLPGCLGLLLKRDTQNYPRQYRPVYVGTPPQISSMLTLRTENSVTSAVILLCALLSLLVCNFCCFSIIFSRSHHWVLFLCGSIALR